MRRQLAIASLIVLATASFQSARAFGASLSTDTVTGLPLYPSAGTPDTTVNFKVCKVKARQNIYVGLTGRNASAIAWFVANVHDAAHTRFNGMGKSQDLFVKGDGSAAVSVTGNQDGSLYGLGYVRFDPNLSAAQRTNYGKGVLGC